MIEKNITRNRVMASLAGACFGLIMVGWPGILPGIVFGFAMYEIGACIKAAR